MIDPGFHVEPASWDADRDALRAIRDQVFIREQQVPVEEEWDELDPQCQHVLARDAGGAAIGTGRLTPTRKIGRMAVLASWRGRGVGAAMLQQLVERARELGWREVSLHAQVSAIGFYQRFGFQAYGEEFEEAGIRHRAMRRELPARQAPPAERGVRPPAPAGEPLQAADSSGRREALCRLLADARHGLTVLAPTLEPRVFEHEQVLSAIRALAVRPYAQLRWLVHDAAPLLADAQRLVALLQRLPSAIEIREVTDEEHRAYPSAFVLNDVGGYLLQPQAGAAQARGATHAPGEHARLARLFAQFWERARPATVLRPLDL